MHEHASKVHTKDKARKVLTIEHRRKKEMNSDFKGQEHDIAMLSVPSAALRLKVEGRDPLTKGEDLSHNHLQN